jgi:phage terminase large subunit
MPRQSLNDFEPVILRYSKKWFNPLYFELRKYIDDPKIRRIMVYGGKSSSKTISICQVLAEKAVSKNYSTLAFRKESTLIPTTLKPSFTLAINSHRLQNAFNTFDRWFKTTWGASIVLKGLDKEEKVKGTEGFQYLYFDELNHFTKEEFDQANLSLRGQDNQKIIGSWNPVNINSWVKKDFLDKYTFHEVSHTLPCKKSFVKISDDGKTVLIKTTYEDNYWIAGSPDGTYGYRDENLIHEYTKLKEIDENSYNVNVNGEWGIDDPNKLFAKDYSHAKHFGKTFKELYHPGLEVFLSWDFNIENTCLAIQNPGNAINVLREYHIKGYDLQMLCDLIKRDFKGHDFIINGDASGKARSALTTGNATAYNLLHQYLDFSWEYQFFVPAANPSHINSRFQTNVILKYHQVNVSEECKELDIDLRSVEIDDNGSMEAYKKKNAARSHHIDPLRYHLNAMHKDKTK